MNRRYLAAAFVAFITAVLNAQTTRLVPSQYPTIQAAISASGNGDDVLVAPGVYPGPITFLGKAITVHSAGGANVTTLTATPGTSVVTFATSEGSASILNGFTVTSGSGIFIQNSSPTIQNCRVINNSRAGIGGGIQCSATNFSMASPVITGCVISNNTAIMSPGSGLGFSGPSSEMSFPIISNCLFSWNAPTTQSGAPQGGGVAVIGNWSVAFSDCTFEHNSTINVGGACYVSAGTATFTSCRFSSNHAGQSGGAVFIDNAHTSFINCSIANNSCVQTGGGLVGYYGSNKSLLIKNCTISGNTAFYAAGGVGLYAGAASPTITFSNSIVWGNSGGVDLESLPASITYSNIGSGFYTLGVGSLSQDPLFANPADQDFHLATISPCRDGGAPGTTGLPAMDLDGTPRLVGTVDMGADEVPALTRPGTADGLDLYATINGAGDPLASTRSGSTGDLLTVRLRSATGSLVGGLPLLAARLYFTGNSFPVPGNGIWLDSQSMIVYGALSAPPFGFPGLPPAGLEFSFTVPTGLAGYTVRMQGLVSSVNALNGMFATTNATEISF